MAILDNAFEGIATAKDNAEKNRANARELFESYLQDVFSNPGRGWEEKTLGEILQRTETINPLINPNKEFIYIDISSVNKETLSIENTTLIKGKNAPSRARKLVKTGDVIFATVRPTLRRIAIIPNEFNAQVCSTGYFVLRTMEQVNNKLVFYFLQTNVFMEKMDKLQKGASYPAVTDGEFRSQCISYPKSLSEQQAIVANLDCLSAEAKKLESIYQQKLVALEELKKSILNQAFNGELTESIEPTNVIPFPRTIPGISTTDLHAGILAIAYQLHESNPKYVETFGHVKAEKIAHMVEACVGIDLGQNPIKDAAGPNDFPRLQQVEFRARKAGYFEFSKNPAGGYSFKKLRRFDEIMNNAKTALGEECEAVEGIISRMLSMDTKQAEIFSTVYAAWNNLLIKNEDASEDAIILEAREKWHKEKLKIPRERFLRAIKWMKANNLVPAGRGKIVDHRVLHERS